MKGVDISNHQKDLSIQQIKNAGYEFAILRGSYTGYGSSRVKNKDAMFEKFYAQAKALGFPIGVYHYSCATNMQEGADEAQFVYENCLKGKQFEFPIYIDVEESRWQLNKKIGVTDAIIGFCEYLEDRGFYAGVYASHDWFKNKIDTSRLNSYTKWVACWSKNKPNFMWNAFDLWQDSSSGYVCGVRIDTDVSFVDFPSIIKRAKLNGYDATYHTVGDGETLTQIAEKYNTTVDQIVKDNHLITVGQSLRV